jgi:hypothetical protein
MLAFSFSVRYRQYLLPKKARIFMKRKLTLALLLALAVSRNGWASDYIYRIPVPGLMPAAISIVTPPSRTQWSTSTPTISLSGDGLTASNVNTTSGWEEAQGNNAHSSGKWYWEVTFDSGSQAWSLGVQPAGVKASVVGDVTGSYGYLAYAGQLLNNGAATTGVTVASKNVTVGVAADLDAGKVSFSVNCVSLSKNISFSPTGASLYPTVTLLYTSAATANFGATSFHCTVPAGYNTGW